MIMEGQWDLTWNTDKPDVLHKNHPNARLVLFDESAHSPFDDEPEKFFDTLRDYVSSLPEVPHRELEQWKEYLSEWRKEKDREKEEKRDPFLKTAISDEEAAEIKRFETVKKRILSGEEYHDLSTPVDALLSFASARISQNPDAYQRVQAHDTKGKVPRASNQYTNIGISIYRVPAWPESPADGDVHPVYVKYEGSDKLSDVEVFIYHQGGWRKLFNVGNPKTDWRQFVERGKSLMKSNQ